MYLSPHSTYNPYIPTLSHLYAYSPKSILTNCKIIGLVFRYLKLSTDMLISILIDIRHVSTFVNI